MEVKRQALQEALERLTQDAESLAQSAGGRAVAGSRAGSGP